MKKSIFLSIIIIATFYLSRYTLRILAYFDIELIGRNLRMNTHWTIGLILILVVSALLYGFRSTFSSLGLAKGFLSGMGRGFVFTLPMILGYAIIGELRTESLALSGLFTVFYWAAMEEVMYRGFLFGQLFRKANWGFVPAVMLNAVVFGMAHLYQGNTFGHTAGVFAITLMGAIWFSWVYIEWENNLWVAISLHFFMNLSWGMFSIGETALGGWGANLFRVMCIALTIVVTIIYRQHKGHFRVNRSNLFFRSDKKKTHDAVNVSGHVQSMMMLAVLFFIFQSPIQARSISGQITSNTSEALAYVNIGLVGTSIGTVSDEAGHYTLYLRNEVQDQDTLCISIIGYKSKYFSLGQVVDPFNISLEEEAFDLPEIVVKPTFRFSETKGREKTNGRMHVNFSRAELSRQNMGAEVAKKFNIKKGRTSQVESLRFYISANNYSEVKFRLLFYAVKKGKPHMLLTDEDIIISLSDKKRGWVDVDLTAYDLITENDFIVSLQWVDADEGSRLSMPIRFPSIGGHHFYKTGSQAKWKRFRNMSTSMVVGLVY